jgi:precorrin-6A/cobalt-precorrin-6A reductase
MHRILILGGTGDAARVIEQVAALPNVTPIASLAGRTPAPNVPSSGTIRRGGFGGIDGLINFLQTEAIDLIIDATHPFAAQISHNAAQAAIVCNIPRILLNRPGWAIEPGDRWIEVPDHAAAATLLPTISNRVFLTIGRQELAAYTGIPDLWCLMRMITPPDPPIPQGEILLDQGPFSLEAEINLLQTHNIGAIVSKNSGGNATYAKIIAARTLGLPVIMIPRPQLPDGPIVHSIPAAIAWVKQTTRRLGETT